MLVSFCEMGLEIIVRYLEAKEKVFLVPECLRCGDEVCRATVQCAYERRRPLSLLPSRLAELTVDSRGRVDANRSKLRKILHDGGRFRTSRLGRNGERSDAILAVVWALG